MTKLSDEADQKFFEQSRKLSPKFPDVATELERRQVAKETLAARILLASALIFGIGAFWADHPYFMLDAAAISFFGFLVVCFQTGSRHDRRPR